MTGNYAIIVEGDGSTNYSAYCPDVPGVAATGDTLDECVSEMREALAFHLEGLRQEGLPVPPPTSRAATVHVDAA
jgi:predicted RNase H-like HicB family nuclease